MGRINYVQSNFTAGEVSKFIYSRSELDRYANAVKLAKNVLINPQGPLSKRPGLRFVAEVKDSSKKTRLVPFKFSVSQTYILEFGHQYIRFYTNEAQLLSGMTPYEIVSPYTENDLWNLKYSQSADVLFLFCPNFPIKQLNRNGALSWSITDLDYIDGPFLDVNTNSVYNLSTSAAGSKGSAVTVTASGTGFTPFVSTDVGRLIRHERGGKWRSIKITSYTSTTSVDGVFQDDNPSGYTSGSSIDWCLGAWSATTGYPTFGCFYQQRLLCVKNQNIYGSKTNGFSLFSPTDVDNNVQDNCGFNYVIGSNSLDDIVWLNPSKVVSIGTIGGEYILKAGTFTNPDPLTPTNVTVTKETKYGSTEDIIVQTPGSNVTLFVDKTQKRIREYMYSYDLDGYVAADLTLLSSHITNSGIKDISFAEGVLWVVLNNGGLLSLTYLREQQVSGFTKHEVGGTDVLVKSVASIDSSDLTYEQPWFIVERTINGVTKQYVEYLEKQFYSHEQDKSNAFFVDSGLSYDGPYTNSVSGLSHLEGEYVSIFADGAYRKGSYQVVGGQISLGILEETKASKIQIGLPYTSLIQTLDYQGGEDAGDSRGKMKRVEKIDLYLIDSMNFKCGASTNKLYDVVLPGTGDIMNQSVDLFTGVHEVEFDGDYLKENSIFLESSDPVPFTVASIMPGIFVHEQ